MRISDWSSDVCSSDLSVWRHRSAGGVAQRGLGNRRRGHRRGTVEVVDGPGEVEQRARLSLTDHQLCLVHELGLELLVAERPLAAADGALDVLLQRRAVLASDLDRKSVG